MSLPSGQRRSVVDKIVSETRVSVESEKKKITRDEIRKMNV